MKKDAALYWKLFSSTFSLSAFTFGGGYVIVPLMRQKFVQQYHWLEEEEMLDLTAIAQSTPGAMAVNASILIGYRIAGITGALTTVLGTVLPPLLILSMISHFYDAFRSNEYVALALKGMQAGVAAVIADVVISMGRGVISLKRALPILVMLATFVVVAFFDANVILVILVCGVIGAIDIWYRETAAKGVANMIYLQLFFSFFQIGLFSIGGGYAAMPLIQHQVVEVHPWMTLTEFTDIITISQMTPGPIAINSASFVGIQVAGIPGAVIATAGCVFPSCVIVLTLAYFYFKYRGLTMVQGVLSGLRPAVVAMIASAGLSILCMAFWNGEAIAVSSTDWIAVAIFASGLFLLRKLKWNPILVMTCSGAAGVVLYKLLPYLLG